MRILIIDDNPDVKAMFDIFRHPEVEYVTVSTESDALSLFASQEQCFDAVLVDLGLPNIDGLELSEQIRINESLTPTCPPVRMAYFTGYHLGDNPDVKRVMKSANVEMVFNKPIDPFTLSDQIKDWLSRPFVKVVSYEQ
jgi:CheY-like chemotaxis protein